MLTVYKINGLLVDEERRMKKKELMKEEERRKVLTKSDRCKEQ
jgi:hypothetical protein